MALRLLIAAIAAAALASCASTPHVTATYYLPKAATTLVVTQTIGCTGDKSSLITATSVTPATTYPADTSEIATLDYNKLSGTFVDADTAISFTTDGRLSGINATGVGEGLNAVKAAITVATTAAAMTTMDYVDHVKIATKSKATAIADACQAIIAHATPKKSAGDSPSTHGDHPAGPPSKPASGGDDDSDSAKTVTLSYKAAFNYERDQNTPEQLEAYKKDKSSRLNCVPISASLPDEAPCFNLIPDPSSVPPSSLKSETGCKSVLQPDPNPFAGLPLTPDSDSKDIYCALRDAIQSEVLLPIVAVASISDITPTASWAKEGDGWDATKKESDKYLFVTLNKLSAVTLVVAGLTPDLSRGELWSSAIRIPQGRSPNTKTAPLSAKDDPDNYLLPVPIAQLFGKTQFTLALGDDGGISKLEYGETSGAADAMNAISAINQAATGQTDAQKAAALQSQADLIYEQQRLVACEASPKTCSSK